MEDITDEEARLAPNVAADRLVASLTTGDDSTKKSACEQWAQLVHMIQTLALSKEEPMGKEAAEKGATTNHLIGDPYGVWGKADDSRHAFAARVEVLAALFDALSPINMSLNLVPPHLQPQPQHHNTDLSMTMLLSKSAHQAKFGDLKKSWMDAAAFVAALLYNTEEPIMLSHKYDFWPKWEEPTKRIFGHELIDCGAAWVGGISQRSIIESLSAHVLYPPLRPTNDDADDPDEMMVVDSVITELDELSATRMSRMTRSASLRVATARSADRRPELLQLPPSEEAMGS